MNFNKLTNVQKLTISGMVMALYIVILYVTQGFSFGAYQIRIATALYALSYIFPFLIVPMGLANFIANMMFGGMGILDMVGGCLVGMATCAVIVLIKQKKLNRWLVTLPIVVIPGFGVSSWLSYILKLPYLPLVFSLCMGQVIPAICGVLLIKVFERSTIRKGVA